MRQFPTEIESDISLYHHRDIADWFTGEMSSRWLWVRIKHLPEDSEHKKALRQGDWDTPLYLLMHVANELKASRADFASSHGATMKPQFITSPAQERERDEEQRQRRDVRSMIMGQIRGEYVPPARDVTFQAEVTRSNPAGGDVRG